jgi:hypothetical protein
MSELRRNPQEKAGQGKLELSVTCGNVISHSTLRGKEKPYAVIIVEPSQNIERESSLGSVHSSAAR